MLQLAHHKMIKNVLVFLGVLLVASPFCQVAQCLPDSNGEYSASVDEMNNIEYVNEDVQELPSLGSMPAPGVDTICVFPKNDAHVIKAGERTEVLVGVKNDGANDVNIVAITASVHLPLDHQMLVQNLTTQGFQNATVSTRVQATFPYVFAVSKYLQPGMFDLAGIVVYEVDQQTHQNVFFNGTVEVIESNGFFSIESVFLVTLGVSLVLLFGLWIRTQIPNISKKSAKVPETHGRTGVRDINTNEWLQGTAFSYTTSNKSKKKK